ELHPPHRRRGARRALRDALREPLLALRERDERPQDRRRERPLAVPITVERDERLHPLALRELAGNDAGCLPGGQATQEEQRVEAHRRERRRLPAPGEDERL